MDVDVVLPPELHRQVRVLHGRGKNHVKDGNSFDQVLEMVRGVKDLEWKRA